MKIFISVKTILQMGCAVLFLFYAVLTVIYLNTDSEKAMGYQIIAMLWLLLLRVESK